MARHPEEADWLRAELLADRLLPFTGRALDDELGRLQANGESEFILNLVRGLLAERPSRPVFQPGTSVNGYKLISILGEGSMGTVWRARQEWIEREVALKVIHTHLFSTDRQARFLREMQTLGKLSHPGIVQIFGAGIYEMPGMAPMPFFAMELIEGLPLDHWAARQSDHTASLLKAMASVCAAVQYAHDRGIVHRDLKPANILVRTDGRPVVLDFGIAQLIGAEMNEGGGGFEGTPLYAAPEQFVGRVREPSPAHDGDETVDGIPTGIAGGVRRGQESIGLDLYAIGVILFEQFSGRFPFDIETGATLWTIRQAKLEGKVFRLGEAWPECPPLLDEIISRTVRRDMIDRVYSTVAELGRALDTAAARLGLEYTVPPVWKPMVGGVIPRTNWKLDQKIGVGGAGEVWLGHHEELGDRRVFKFCDTEEKARTLRRELTVYRLLRERIGRNPHFVPLIEASLAEAPWYLMMEHIDAVDLIAWCAAIPGGVGTLPLPDRIEIVAQVAEALQAAHEAGILHRDLKPANLLVKGKAHAGTDSIHVLIADFGIGQIVAEEALRNGGIRSGFTRTVSEISRSTVSGTFSYLAPEVLGGQSATARSDIYSLGIIFWQLLVGDFATGLHLIDWEKQVQDPHIRSDLMRCLAGKPEERWASAGDLAQNLRQLPERRMAEELRQQAKAAGERRAYWRGVALTAGLGATAIVAFALLAYEARRQKRTAEELLGVNQIEQLMNLERTDLSGGRRRRGLQLFSQALHHATDKAALRSAAAVVLGLSDLEPPSAVSSPTNRIQEGSVFPGFPAEGDETARVRSNDGRWLAIARDRNGMDGALDLVDLKLRTTNHLQWTNFPWMPIGEPNLLRISPQSDCLALGGGTTSRNLLLLTLPTGRLETYLFHSSDPLCCAWHPEGRILATGNADHTVLLWDTKPNVHASLGDGATEAGVLPPVTTVPAIDHPILIIRSHRHPIQSLDFSSDGRWLASVDTSGVLQIHSGLQAKVLDSQARDRPNLFEVELPLQDEVLAEWNLQDPSTIRHLSFHANQLWVYREPGRIEALPFLPKRLPMERSASLGISHLAWTPDGKRLCALTSQDILWMDSDTLNIQGWEANANADDVIPDPTSGNLRFSLIVKAPAYDTAGTERLRPCLRTSRSEPVSQPEPIAGLDSFDISDQEIVPMLGTDDGRFVIRVGRQMAFMKGDKGGNPSLVTKVGKEGDQVQDWFWDSHGGIFGVVVGASDQLRLEVWSSQAGGGFPDFAAPHLFAISGNSLVVPANDGMHAVIRNPERGLAICRPQSEGLQVIDSSEFARQKQPMAASHDGRFLAMVSDSHRIRLLELPSGKFFAEFVSQRRAPIQMIVWRPDGQQLASVTGDGYIQVWALSEWWKLLAEDELVDGSIAESSPSR